MQFPLFTPPTEWVMPDGYPDLSEAREVSIDLETVTLTLHLVVVDGLVKMVM